MELKTEISAMNDSQPWWYHLNRFSFSDNSEMAAELAELVVRGIKLGTSWLVSEGEQTMVGQQHVVLDGNERPVAVIETIELRKIPFNEVDSYFAYDCGEDDRSLTGWRSAYQRYFERHGKFKPDMLMYCERFRLIEVISDQVH